MAVKTIKFDDLDNGTEGVDTYRFGFLGQEYEIDLSGENFNQLQALLDGYVAAATPVSSNGGTVKRSPVKRQAKPKPVVQVTGNVAMAGQTQPASNGGGADKQQTVSIRRWALDNGFKVGDRGRIAQEIRDAYAARP